jgi:hypothetical protein
VSSETAFLKGMGAMIKRTVLYYPSISIPNGPWLRRALFYFDEVASIVPRTVYFSGEEGELLVPLSPEVEFLLHEGVFRAVSPEELHMKAGWDTAHRFSSEFLKAVEAAGYRLAPGGKRVRLHRGKLTGTILEGLVAKGLVQYDAPAETWWQAQWLLVEEETAQLFMAMLAQYMADLDAEATVPATDRIDVEERVYRARCQEEGFPCIETRFSRVLPTPRDDVALTDILDFKHKREAELLEYRGRVDALQQQLSAAEDRGHVKQALVQFEEAQRKDLKNLRDAMADARMATVWGSMKALIKTSSPALWGSTVAAVFGAPAVAASIALTGVTIAAMIEVRAYLVDRRNEKRATERKSGFAYVQHAQEEGIL